MGTRCILVWSRALATLLVVAWAASLASAGYVADFESANPFSGGTLSTTFAHGGSTQSLYLAAGVQATLAVPAEYAGNPVRVSMWVYDLGKWIDRTVTGHPTDAYGSRWGVAGGTFGAGQSVGATIIERLSLASGGGYGYSTESSTSTGSWYSPSYYSTRAVLSANGGTNDGSGWVMGTAADPGVWTYWQFDIATDGAVSFFRDSRPVVTTNYASNPLTLGGEATRVWLFGGRTGTVGAPLAALYVDDVEISIVPEPATMGLLGLGLVALLRRRRR